MELCLGGILDTWLSKAGTPAHEREVREAHLVIRAIRPNLQRIALLLERDWPSLRVTDRGSYLVVRW